MAVQDYKINYKSDFVLNINGDAGWAIPFCIKFWTGMPSQAYFVGFDGVKYVNCRVGDTPTQLLVMFDDHHLPIGKLKMQIAYHTTIEEFPGSVFDEVTNARDVIVTIDGTDYQVMLDFTGEDAPELEFDLPAYANEAERIQNELQRQQNEAERIAAELQREQATADAVQGAENVNAQLNGTTLTVTNRQGVSTSVNTKGEMGEQGPEGPEGPQGETGISIVSFLPKSETATTLIYTITYSNGYTQDVAIPKGPKGDTGATGLTGPQGPRGDTGVSITGFVETGETETTTLYNITFSNGTTQEVAIPKGEKGDQGPVGPQGPQGQMGDVAVITPEQQAAFTMYSVPGQNTDGPMTQKAVTDRIEKTQISGSSFDVTWEEGNIDVNTGTETTAPGVFRSSPIAADKFLSVSVSSPLSNSGLRLYNGVSYLGSISLGYGGSTADVSSYNANKIRVIIASDVRNNTKISGEYQNITPILEMVERSDIVTNEFTDNITWERGGINSSTGEEITADAVRSSAIEVNGRFLSCTVETELSVTIAIRLYHNDTYITSVTLGAGGGTSPNLYSYNANRLRVISAGHKLSETSVLCQYVDEKMALPLATSNESRIDDIENRITSDDVLKSYKYVSGSDSGITFDDVYPAGTYVLEVTGSGAMSPSFPSTWPDWLHVIVRDLNDTAILTPIAYIYGSTFEDRRVRFYVGENFKISPWSYYEGDITMKFMLEKDSVTYLSERINGLEASGVVTINESDIELDLSTEVMGLTGKSTTNYRYNTSNNTPVSSNSWILIEDTIPASPGFYYVVDGTGSTKLFQIAYLDGNGNVVKVHGTDNGTTINAVSKYFIEAFNVVSMKIAVKATSPTGLHFINGRKYIISDPIKRAAFYNQCSDGKINLAYISGSNTVDRFTLANKIASEFGVVKVPSGRYEIGSTLWLGAQGQSYEFASDSYIVASSSFNADYLVVWGCAAYENRDQDFPNSTGEDSAMTNSHIWGGVFDVKGKGGCVRLYYFKGFEIKGCTFYNAKTNGISVEAPGYELVLHNCYARNSFSGLKGNVAYNIQTSDCHFHDLIAVNYSTGFRVHNSSGFLTRCHPWTAIKDFSEYYPGSIGFDIGSSTGVVLTDCYSDTMQTHYKTGNQTKMIGCTALSVKKDVFPIDLYGDVNIIDNDKQGVVLIGCMFRCSGTTIVENSGSVAVTKIGCT